jgi:hypothetical protein
MRAIAALVCLLMVQLAASQRSIAASVPAPVGRRAALVSLPGWSLVAWRNGPDVCFLWHGEPTAIETASGCRRPPRSIGLLVGETGTTTRLAGLTSSAVASVSVRTGGITISTATRTVRAALGARIRFFLLQFRARLPAPALAGAHWTLVAKDANDHPLATLVV